MKAFITFLCLIQLTFSQNQKINLLVITGGPSLRHHTHLVPTSFYKIFFDIKNLNWDHASSDEAAFQSERLMTYDLIILYNRSDSITTDSQAKLKSYLEAGKPLIVLHHALGSYNNWDWWWQDVVGAKYQMLDTDKHKKSGYKQDLQIKIMKNSEHPLTEGFKTFTLMDETYKDLIFTDKVKPLLKTDHETSDGPIMWIGPYQKAKVLVIQPGHASSAHLDENYIKLIKMGIDWVIK